MNHGRSLLIGALLLAGCSGSVSFKSEGDDDASLDGRDATMLNDAADGGSSADGSSSAPDGGGTGTGDATVMRPPDGPPGPPGCGLAAAAFCDHFDAPAATLSRAGELDATKWSGAHGYPQGPTEPPFVVPIQPATVSGCHAGLPAKVYPSQDALICDPNANINSRHLLVASGAQNYGQNSYRIRQPFDFAGRTGRVVFDGEGFFVDGLLGWISVAVTEDPAPAPGTAFGPFRNDEGSAVLRNAVQVHFRGNCPSAPGTRSISVSRVIVTKEHVDTEYVPTNPPCITTAEGHLNRFAIDISRTRIAVLGSDYSANGADFAATKQLYATNVDLPFDRGYVQLTTHNHATIKYSQKVGDKKFYDAWLARWDNVGFDGPTATSYREYSIPDSLKRVTHQVNHPPDDPPPPAERMNVGYVVPRTGEGTLSLTFSDVDISNVKSAAVALSSWYFTEGSTTRNQFNLRYRLNGNAWHDRMFTAAELAMAAQEHILGQFSQMLSVPVSELKAGNNTIEFTATNIPMNLPPAVYNIDLVLGL